MISYKLILLQLFCIGLSKTTMLDTEEFSFVESFLECNKKEGVNLEQFLNHFKSTRDLVKFAKKKNHRCWEKCYYEAEGLTNIDGQLDISESIRHVLEWSADNKKMKKYAVNIVFSCMDMVVPQDLCISIPMRVKCLQEEVLNLKYSSSQARTKISRRT